MRRKLRILASIAVLGASFYFQSLIGMAADKPPEDAEALAKKSQNPIADMMSVPLQYNWYTGGAGGTVRVLNIQPVVPVQLNKEWNLITRTIIPLMSVPTSTGKTVSGAGDSNISFFFSPRTSGSTTWGVGPIVQLPTASDTRFGTKTYGAGPTAVIVKMDKQWVYGGLVNYIGSFDKSSSGQYTSLLYIQPFVNYNLPHRRGMALSFSPGITCDYTRASGDRWTVPIGMGVSQMLKIGAQPASISVGAYYNAIRPENAAVWNYRFQFTFLFPK